MAGSGTGPPHMPECSDCLSARTSTSHGDQAAQRGGDRRQPGLEVAGVGEHDGVGGQACLACFCRNSPRCPEPISSSPSTMIFTLSGSAPAPEPGVDRGGVHDDARLVVGGAAPVEAAVALGRLEGRRSSSALVARGLHVVVRVEQQRRLARRLQDLAVDVGVRALELEQLHVLEAALLEQEPRWPRRSRAPAPGRSRGTRRWGCAPAFSGRLGRSSSARRTAAAQGQSPCTMDSATRPQRHGGACTCLARQGARSGDVAHKAAKPRRGIGLARHGIVGATDRCGKCSSEPRSAVPPPNQQQNLRGFAALRPSRYIVISTRRVVWRSAGAEEDLGGQLVEAFVLVALAA